MNISFYTEMAFLAYCLVIRERSHIMSAADGGGGQVNLTWYCLGYKKTIENADVGEGAGVKNLENIADIICERSLIFGRIKIEETSKKRLYLK